LIDYWEDAQEFIRLNASYCSGIDSSEIDRLTSTALHMAAQLGDEEAAACFVADSMFYARINDGTRTYPAERDDSEIAALYETDALQLAERGVTLGDWRMVLMLSSGRGGGIEHALRTKIRFES
jgi:hypothetical protein